MNKTPCPELEFRVINRIHGRIGGEIIDATMNIVASSIHENQAALALKKFHKEIDAVGKRTTASSAWKRSQSS
jgi:hypothetical protein